MEDIKVITFSFVTFAQVDNITIVKQIMIKNGIYLFAVVSIILIVGCKSTKKVSNGPEMHQYAMHVGPCFGYCPVFDIYVFEDGKAIWDARRFHKTNGKFQRMLSEAELAQLNKAFKEANLFKMEDEYPTMVADLPAITLSHVKKGKVKTVEANEKMPDAYEKCVDLMRQITKDGNWEMVEKYADDEPQRPVKKEEALNYNEIIIEPSNGTSLPRWFKENEAYGIYLIRKISPDLNLWLIGYDKNQFEPKMMLDMLKKDTAIKTAEFNKQTEERN